MKKLLIAALFLCASLGNAQTFDCKKELGFEPREPLSLAAFKSDELTSKEQIKKSNDTLYSFKTDKTFLGQEIESIGIVVSKDTIGYGRVTFPYSAMTTVTRYFADFATPEVTRSKNGDFKMFFSLENYNVTVLGLKGENLLYVDIDKYGE